MLNEKGIPTPLVHTMLCPPRSRMDILTDAEIDKLVSGSKLAGKYNQAIDSESAYEILTGKLDAAAQKADEEKQVIKEQKQQRANTKKEDTIFDNPMVKQVGRTAASVITRSLLGVLGLGGRRGRSLF